MTIEESKYIEANYYIFQIFIGIYKYIYYKTNPNGSDIVPFIIDSNGFAFKFTKRNNEPFTIEDLMETIAIAKKNDVKNSILIKTIEDSVKNGKIDNDENVKNLLFDFIKPAIYSARLQF
jgi:hypothetical protein